MEEKPQPQENIFSENYQTKNKDETMKKEHVVQLAPWMVGEGDKQVSGVSLVIKTGKVGGKKSEVYLDANDKNIRDLIGKAYKKLDEYNKKPE